MSRTLALVALLPVLLPAPIANKAFHIDETVYIKNAHSDFYYSFLKRILFL